MNKQVGLSLVNLLITLSILGIITSFAIPGFSALINQQKAVSTINQLIGTLQFARLSALERGKTITLCPKANNTECGKDWSQGIIVFEDLNKNGVLEPSEQLIRVAQFIPQGARLKWVSFGSNNYLRYANDGSTINQNGSFTFCPSNNDNLYARVIIINRSGRPRRGQDSNHNGITETASGKDVSC